MLLNAEGTLCLSGSSDHTLRLWDLGQQRCLHTYAVHTDSVWALQASQDFSLAYTGGRDGCCYRCMCSMRPASLSRAHDSLTARICEVVRLVQPACLCQQPDFHMLSRSSYLSAATGGD